MYEKIIDKIDFKWWSSLEAQQKLTVGMSIIIVALFFIIIMQEQQKTTIRSDKNTEIARQQARADACYESQVIYVKEKEKFSQEMLFRYLELNKKTNETDNN